MKKSGLTNPSTWFAWLCGLCGKKQIKAEIPAAQQKRMRSYPLLGACATMEVFSYKELKKTVDQFRSFLRSFIALLQGRFPVNLPKEVAERKPQTGNVATKLLNNIETGIAAAQTKRDVLEGISRCEESEKKAQTLDRVLNAVFSENEYAFSDDDYDLLTSQTRIVREAVREAIRGCYSNFPNGPDQDLESRLAQLHDDLSWWLSLVGAIDKNDSVFVPEESLCRRLLPVVSILIALLKDVKEFVEEEALLGEPADRLVAQPLARNIGGLVTLWTVWCKSQSRRNTSFTEKLLAWHLPKESAVDETRQALRYGRSHLRDVETPMVMESKSKYSLLLEILG